MKLKSEQEITIGKYRLYYYNFTGTQIKGIHISMEDGEGGVFDSKELEKVIEKFYNDNF